MATDGQEAYRPGYSVAADRILEHIKGNGLGPGDRLPTEADFAAMLGVSRSIARDALKTLAAKGRIVTQRGRGIFVAEGPSFSPGLTNTFNPKYIEDIMMLFEFRAIQEKAAAELAAKRSTPAELMAIENALAEYAAHVPSRDREHLSRADEMFHAAIARATHNDFLVDSAGASMRLQQRAANAVAHGSADLAVQALEEHTAIFDSIRRGDADAAGKAALAHLERTRRGYEAEIGRRVFQREPTQA
ncbi:FadR/GntR family transcriptional regulator [Streptomyces sp. NPDC020917]|uniref:FadR/GntR family transcriptional regulator n=1 Tax=Streptomyces sp. NPDC020917 TaxID=3365102 RepID=UPI0037A73A7B